MAAPQLLINGELVAAAKTFPVLNPSTLEECGRAPHADQAQVDAAVAAANEALPGWAALPLRERKKYVRKAGQVLKENVAELGKLLSAEQGKPLSQAAEEGEMAWAGMVLQKGLKEIELKPHVVSDEVKVFRRPIGVVAGITPWNFPVFCTVQKWVPALILGNTFVHKPSPFTPLTGLRIGELLKDVFPKGVFNVVSGDDKADFNVGAHLSNHPGVNMISFTGSVATGKRIMAACAGGMRRVNIEAGGNDAAIVLPDCDPKQIAGDLFRGAFVNNGQTCCAAKRVYVHDSIHDDVVSELVKCAETAKVGDGMSPDTQFGPLNNKMQLDKVSALVEDARKAPGAKIECGGAPLEGHKGYFYKPTIISGVAEGVRIVDEEQFGPVCPVIKYSEVEDAIRRANASPFGLGGSVWSPDTAKAARLAGRLQAGTVWVNGHAGLTGGPFGGFKDSGIGRELGFADLTTFTELQTMKVPKKEVEKRRDPTDPKSKKTYTKKEFVDFYGKKQGERVWAQAGGAKEGSPKRERKVVRE
eukprot:TRINITY_DN39208_c0_g1_i1.p1 TRINITY_DN39208_c0_g1~~TRINITY_DN39208_c0_g1_i1.p1  ORF type:complete len:547 (+),score=206.61 TRINITY_DN39208_c0_g1_i1:56-1642(+)